MDQIDWKKVDNGEKLDANTTDCLLEMGIDHKSFPWHQRLIHRVKGFLGFSAIRRYVYHDEEAGFRTGPVWWCSALARDGVEINAVHGSQSKIHDFFVFYIVTNSSVI
jgi:hypothetical protein